MLRRAATAPPNLGIPFDLERTLLKHVPLVRFLAQRIHSRLPGNIDIDDLVSAGMLGLIQACDKFDAAKNIQFASFASFRIRGAILDSLRMLDWAPRTLRHKGKVIQAAIQVLTARLGDAPSQEQVALELKITLVSYQKTLGELDGLQIGPLHLPSKDSSSEEEVVAVASRPEEDPLHCCIEGETRRRLVAAIGNLSDRERQVVALHYYEELSLREVATAMGVSANQIAYIRSCAMSHLRAALSPAIPRPVAKTLPWRQRGQEGALDRLPRQAAA